MHKRILVVEDDQGIREVLEAVFQMLGYRVDLVENGQEALASLQSEDVPCLIILDLMMPVMNGQKFRDLQLADPRIASIPVVVISADSNAKQKAQALGAVEGFVKPIELKSLLEVAGKYCGAA